MRIVVKQRVPDRVVGLSSPDPGGTIVVVSRHLSTSRGRRNASIARATAIDEWYDVHGGGACYHRAWLECSRGHRMERPCIDEWLCPVCEPVAYGKSAAIRTEADAMQDAEADAEQARRDAEQATRDTKWRALYAAHNGNEQETQRAFDDWERGL